MKTFSTDFLNPDSRVHALRKQLLHLEREVEQLRTQPTQLVIQQLENNIEQLHVSTLDGILSIGIALNQSGAIDADQIKVGNQTVEELIRDTRVKAQPDKPPSKERTANQQAGQSTPPEQAEDLTDTVRNQLRSEYSPSLPARDDKRGSKNGKRSNKLTDHHHDRPNRDQFHPRGGLG
ncbi:MAG: hypothetical protein H0Z34_01470 [Brevibacillus sp.]|nr:hypothetical protein [Brevibacillus sp.]